MSNSQMKKKFRLLNPDKPNAKHLKKLNKYFTS